MLKILTVFGTRPEAIKMAPVVAELAKHNDVIDAKTCITGQHADMVSPIIELFGIKVDYDLKLMRDNQTLEHITVSVLHEVSAILRAEKFDLVLVQGDTTTSMAAGLAAFYCRVKIGHIEAGLRTYDKEHPFPEEVNRRMIDSFSDLYFAHSDRAKATLIQEGVAEDLIEVTGNTVIDALLDVANRPFDVKDSPLQTIPFVGKRLILVTAHRRESFGGPFESICRGISKLAAKYGNEIAIVYPVHRNPNVRAIVYDILGDLPNVHLIEPLDYLPLVYLMKHCVLVLTDSGGLQEEAPSLDIPVLVMRKVTERQEGVEAGTLKVIGTDQASIVDEASMLLDDPGAYAAMARARNPYGDGSASRMIAERILLEYEQGRFGRPTTGSHS